MENKFNNISNKFILYMNSVIPNSKIGSGGKEFICRCRYCEDSKNISHGHMYIHIPQDKDDPALFHCFKCLSSGILDSRRMMEWGIYDPDLASNLDEIYSNASKSGKVKGYNRTVYNLQNVFSNAILANKKVEYINKRLGLQLLLHDYLQLKIIFNLKETIDYNHLEYTRHPNIMNQLNDNFVGFLSVDNNFVNLRRICDEGIVYQTIDKRYINYNSHNKKDNTEKFYVVPSIIDLNQGQRINIHVAEGPFDILSIKYNVNNDAPGLYAAIGGAGYMSVIMYIISTFKIFNCNLHIYPDNDKVGSFDKMKNIIDYLKPYNIPIYLHRNIFPNEKDFGVPKNRIQEQIQRY